MLGVLIVMILFTYFVDVVESSVDNCRKNVSPNIVIIMADDMGWDDVSFHGSNQVLTPNIDALASTGKCLGRYYSHSICTPSRSAFLTGKYAHTIGMQGFPLLNSEDRGLPLTEKLLPQYLREHGYATHLVGKWHVGSSRSVYLPTSRGFQDHMGHRGGFISYNEYVLEEMTSSGKVPGLDLYRNNTPAWDIKGYITDIYNQEAKSIIKHHDESKPLFLMITHNAPHSSNDASPLEAPPETVREMRYIESPERRVFAAMVKKLDDSVGDVIEALCEKGIINNTIVVFVSDNGGMTSGLKVNYASNWPLKGIKMTPFEGGIRVTGLVWSAKFDNSHNLWNGYMHVSDWVPTILSMAGIKPPAKLDGFDQWDNIKFNRRSDRKEIYEIDDYQGFAALISGNYKLITGNVEPAYSNHQGDDLRGIIGEGPSYIDTVRNCKVFNSLHKIGKSYNVLSQLRTLRNTIRITCNDRNRTDCIPNSSGKSCLFNIIEDPCETKDLSELYPEKVKTMLNRLQIEVKYKTKPRKVPYFTDPRSFPSLHNYTWITWADNITS